MDPDSLRTYLYCEATEHWHWEEPEDVVVRPPPPAVPVDEYLAAEVLNASPVEEQVADVDVAWPQQHQQQEEEQQVEAEQPQQRQKQAQQQSIATDPEIVLLAQTDPIVRDLIKDDLRLRKKLREIEALEAASAAGQRLEDTQVAKIGRRAAVVADLKVAQEQLEEAKRQMLADEAPLITSASASPPAPPSGGKRKQPQKSKAAKPVETVSPLPQQGKAPLPISAAVLAAGFASNNATRLAAYAPNPVLPTKVTPAVASAPGHYTEASSDRRGLLASASPTVSVAGARRTQAPTVASAPVSTAPRRPPATQDLDASRRPAAPPIPTTAFVVDDVQRKSGGGGGGGGGGGDGFQQVKRKGKAKK